MEQQLLNELKTFEVSIANQRKERVELQSWSFSDYFGTIFYRDFDGDMEFCKWYCLNLANVKRISKINNIVEKMDNSIQDVKVSIRNVRKEIRKIQEKYSQTKYFDKDRLKAGMLVEFDYSGGLNSSGVTYCLTTVTKTYVEGYSIIGSECGSIRKITKPKQLVFLY